LAFRASCGKPNRTPACHEPVTLRLSSITWNSSDHSNSHHFTSISLLPFFCVFIVFLLHSILIVSSSQMRASLRRCALKPDRVGTKHYNDPRYPLTEKLVDVFGGFKNARAERRLNPKKSHDRMPGKRAEIVSEQLCGRSLSQSTITCPAISNSLYRRHYRVLGTQLRGVQGMYSHRCSPWCMPVVIKTA
jgi:hypothetical protein